VLVSRSNILKMFQVQSAGNESAEDSVMQDMQDMQYM
jgi:hypothetical protein